MNNLSELEALLLKQEITALNIEMRKGVDIIIAALKKYTLIRTHKDDPYPRYNVSDEDLKAFNKYIDDFKIGSRYYYAGDHLSVDAVVSEPAVPDFVKKVLTTHACKQFLDQVNNVSNVVDQLEQSR